MERQLTVRVLQGKTLAQAVQGTGSDVITAKKIIRKVITEAAPEMTFDWDEVQFAKTIKSLRGYASYLINAINVMENK